jgi:hypothetical protein
MLGKFSSIRTRPQAKTVLRLPDLDQVKSAVLNSLTSADAQPGHRHAIDEFVEWYCSEPRLPFQPNCCPPPSDSSRISPPRSRDNQPSLRAPRKRAHRQTVPEIVAAN